MPEREMSPADTQTGAWRGLRWSLPFLAALLPIVLLSLFSYQVASRSVSALVQAENMSAATNVSQLLTQDFKRVADIAYAIASVPGTKDAVRRKDDIAMRARLKAIVLAYPQVDRVFMTDREGMLWTDYPQIPGVFGKSQAESDWYEGWSARWKPYISNVYVRPHDPETPVIAIATSVYDETGRVIGALVMEYRTALIHRWLQDIRVGRGGLPYIVDGNGVIVAHPRLPADALPHTAYAAIEPIARSRADARVLVEEYRDPVDGALMMATFQPLAVGSNDWVVVAQQPRSIAYRPLEDVRLSISLAGVFLTLVTTGMVVAIAIVSRRNERLNRELTAKNTMLRDITSFVSHQLRAPVTAMRWAIEEMLDGDYGPVSTTLKEPLKQLHGVAIQNGQLINDILNVSRIDRGVIEVRTAPVSLADVAERAVRDYRTAIEKAGLNLIVRGTDVPVLVEADAEKMAEAVSNAISNAIKHTKRGGITLTLRADDRFGYVDVADTGEGMTPEMLSALFTRAGVKGVNADSAQSSGLGLYIARTFMQLQRGDITVSSRPGKGSTFTYAIPLATARAEPDSDTA